MPDISRFATKETVGIFVNICTQYKNSGCFKNYYYMKEEAMQWETEKKEALDSWIESAEEELEFAEAIHDILENSTTKEEFIRLAKEKLQEYKNPWIEDTLQSIVKL